MYKDLNTKTKIGILLIVLSVIMFTIIFMSPFIPVDNKYKITIGTVSLILGEICFWVGGLLVGKDLFNKYKSKLNPKNWSNKNNKKIE